MEKKWKSFEEAWTQIKREPNVWDYLEIKDQSFYYNYEDKSIFLSSFKSKDLPVPPYSLKFLGKILTQLSHFAKIMSCRPGTEEVTFYALLNSPQSGILGRKIDQKMLNIAAPPLVWRRERIRKFIQQKIELYLKSKQTFMFVDIGCGAGFDSLEIERLINRTNELTGSIQFINTYLNLNIDIDSDWLKNNQMLTNHLFGEEHNIVRENISAFDFLSQKKFQSTLHHYDNLIISCNGFAEFLTDLELRELYCGIQELAKSFDGSVSIILPFANKNEKHEAIGNKIGFQFRAKEKNEIISMIEEIFQKYTVTHEEEHSQIVITIEK